ncbi:hypothetical protein PIB30_068909, partial [Stylosanthes scabra]|nr:hypothetical protein [Stylosanthes scabra]
MRWYRCWSLRLGAHGNRVVAGLVTQGRGLIVSKLWILDKFRELTANSYLTANYVNLITYVVVLSLLESILLVENGSSKFLQCKESIRAMCESIPFCTKWISNLSKACELIRVPRGLIHNPPETKSLHQDSRESILNLPESILVSKI